MIQELVVDKPSFKVVKSKTISGQEYFSVVRKRDGHYMTSTWFKSDAINELSYHQDMYNHELCRHMFNLLYRLISYE